jgi:hypothetical protein
MIESRTKQLVLRLNEIAQVRKSTYDTLWLKVKKMEAPDEEFMDCLDKLWTLETETEALRLELLKLIKGSDDD